MPIYRVSIAGSNLLMDVDGRLSRYGFAVSRYVEASAGDAAADHALATIRESRQVRLGARNSPGDPPILRVVEIEELRGEGSVPIQPGFAFYPQDVEA